MEVLEGLLFINKKDVFKEYGVFLHEDKAGAHTNYNELLKPPSMKDYVAVSFRERDGEQLPENLPMPRFEARDVTLQFTLLADTKAEFMNRYTAFIALLRSGWLDIRLPELERTYRMYYKDCTGYEQLSYLKEEAVYAAQFKVKFREPQPAA